MEWTDLPLEEELNLADLLDRMGVEVTEGNLAGVYNLLLEYGIPHPSPFEARFPTLIDPEVQ